MTKPTDLTSDQLLSAKRARKRSRWIVRQSKVRKRAGLNAASLNQRYGARSKLIDMLSNYATTGIKADRYRMHIKVPTKFSIIDDPETVIEFVTGCAAGYREAKMPIRCVIIDHSSLKAYDLAANALLDLFVVEVEAERKRRNARRQLRVEGFYPANKDVKRFIRSLGIIKHLDIEHEAPKADEAKDIRIFDVHNKHYLQNLSGAAAGFKERQVAKFVEHIDRCLEIRGRRLSVLGKHQLSAYMGEILNNAEDHAGFVDWTVQGYLDKALNVPMCEIGIFNFGKSIAETLAALPTDCFTREQIQGYVSMHQRNGFFDAVWREEDLLTVVALQGGVSCKNLTAQDTRGQGTVDLIKFFQAVHAECCPSGGQAQMAILSGGTFIAFDGTYRMDGESERIAFNEFNDLHVRPDRRYVRSMGSLRFPGTIISIRFPLPLQESKLVTEAEGSHGAANEH